MGATGGARGAVGVRLSFWECMAVLRRRLAWFLVPLLVVPAIALAVSTSRPSLYDAEASVLLTDSAAKRALDDGAVSNGVFSRSLENEISLAGGADVRAEAQARLAGIDPESMSVAAAPGADVLVFSVTERDALGAAQAANAWAEAFVQVKRDSVSESIDGALLALENRLDGLAEDRSTARAPLTDAEKELASVPSDQDRATQQIEVEVLASSLAPILAVIDARIATTVGSISELELNRQLSGDASVTFLEPAVPPEESTKQSTLSTLVLGLTAGLFAGLGAAIMSDRVDRKINSARDIESAGLRVIGTVPEMEGDRFELGRSLLDDPSGEVAASYHRVRTALQFALAAEGHRSVVVTSAMVNESKTSSATNLAVGIARTGKSVLLVDADLRRPQLAEIFDLEENPGLSDCARETSRLRSAVHTVDLGGGATIKVLPAGAPNRRPDDLLVSDGFEKTIENVANLAELAIIDSPPVLAVADAVVIAQRVDAVVLVARNRQTKRSELVAAAAELERVGGEIVGVVLVGVEPVRSYYTTD